MSKAASLKQKDGLGTVVSSTKSYAPDIFALFQKRFKGDDALLHLAQLRFGQVGLGTEFYVETPEELEWLLHFKPSPQTPAMAHLSRKINLFDKQWRTLLAEYAYRFRNRILGFVIHDQIEAASRFDDYAGVLRDTISALAAITDAPTLYLEYAAGIDPELFVRVFSSFDEAAGLGACVDIGHVGLWRVRQAFAEMHPGQDVCALPLGDKHHLISDIQKAAGCASDKVVEVVKALGPSARPVHFHLHDGHPLSTASPYGICDHLSFFDEVPISFVCPSSHSSDCTDKRFLPPMFGRSGLSKILGAALEFINQGRLSFTLEIHPGSSGSGGSNKRALADADHLFLHWQDKTNAERMNGWLQVLADHYRFIMDEISRSVA